MIGLKIAFTGLISALIFGTICKNADISDVPTWLALVILIGFFGGLIATVGGVLYWIWV